MRSQAGRDDSLERTQHDERGAQPCPEHNQYEYHADPAKDYWLPLVDACRELDGPIAELCRPQQSAADERRLDSGQGTVQEVKQSEAGESD